MEVQGLELQDGDVEVSWAVVIAVAAGPLALLGCCLLLVRWYRRRRWKDMEFTEEPANLLEYRGGPDLSSYERS